MLNRYFKKKPEAIQIASHATVSPRRLKVLHLGFEDFRRPGSGGGAIRTHEINKRLSKYFDITVLTTKYAGSTERTENGIRYLHIGRDWGYFGSILTYFVALPWNMRKHQYDLIIEDFAAPFSSSLSPLWSHKPNIAMVQWLNAKEKSRQYHLPFWIIEKLGLKLHHRYIAVSNDLATKIRSQSIGADVSVVANGAPYDAFRTPLGLPRQDIIFLGRIEREQKGLDLLLDAYALIAGKTSSNLVLVGDGPDEDWVKTRIHELGLGGRVKLAGRIDGDKKHELLAAAQVVAMPSRFETFGMVAIEGLAAGTPVVAFDIPCLSEVVPLDLGIVVPAFDIRAFARALLTYVRPDPGDSLKLQLERRDFARQYDWDKLAVLQKDIYLSHVSMVGTEDQDSREHRQQSKTGRRALISGLAALAVAAITVAIRLVGAGRLYDLHIDEITYVHFAQTIAAGHLPLLFGGDPFFLHPPGYFALLAVWRSIVWHGGDIFAEYVRLRSLNIVLSGITALLIYAITKRLTKNIWVALGAAALFAVDPFTIRHNTRSLIETSATTWLFAGLWLTLRAERLAKAPLYWIGTGIVFGLGVVTKDMVAIFIALTFIFMWVTGTNLPRRTLRYMIPSILIPYAVWIGIIANNGLVTRFFDEKTVGIRRFLGLIQVSGFNVQGTPTKSDALFTTIIPYGSSYALMGLGTIGALVLLTSRSRLRRQWGCIGLASVVMLGYTFTIGAMEEQFLYYLLVPGIITVAVTSFDLVKRLRQLNLRRLVIGSSLATFIMLMSYGGVAYAFDIQRPDNGWTNTIKWVDANVPRGNTILVFGQGQFLFTGRGYQISDAGTINKITAQHVGYVIVSRKLALEGYTPLSIQTVTEIYEMGRIVHTYNSRDSGIFDVIELPAAQLSVGSSNSDHLNSNTISQVSSIRYLLPRLPPDSVNQDPRV